MALCFLAIGCRRHPITVEGGLTGVSLTVRYDPSLMLTSLAISGVVAGPDAGAQAFEPGMLPEKPRPLTSGTETASILLPASFGGTMVTVHVDGLTAGQMIVGSVEQTVLLVAGKLVALDMRLGSASPPPSCDAHNCANGCCDGIICRPGTQDNACGTGGLACQTCMNGACVAGVCTGAGGCDAETCPGGCCSGSTCYSRSVVTCGPVGGACVSCDAGMADSCSITGTCRCGGGAACTAGQRCMNGVCVCDVQSCPAGCCQGNVCMLVSQDSCAAPGAACVACDHGSTSQCRNTGTCGCGDGPPCAGGLRCQSGQCVCTADSCLSGCCQTQGGNQICVARSLATCGVNGNTCVACDQRSDNCSSMGACRCGISAPCGMGQRCSGSSCMCDAMSCPNGCCTAAGLCVAGSDPAACGAGGNLCDTCPTGETCTGGSCSGCNATTCASGCCIGSSCNAPAVGSCGVGGAVCTPCDATRADSCTGGACRCGATAACAAGQRCVAGKCTCDATSCPNGCCSAPTSTSPSICVTATSPAQCGAAGAMCKVCGSTTSDGCSAAGACLCGEGGACGTGQRCVSGTCVCNKDSCPSGCCAGDVCQTPSGTACGTMGGACRSCGATGDGCSTGGQCQCGGGLACVAGQRCLNGKCACDRTSCPNGCCSGDFCLPGASSGSCGTGGGMCQNCNGAACTGGVCAGCDATTCPSGCCSGASCTKPPSPAACGLAGGACVPCDPSIADNCSSVGDCSCGNGPACGAGQACRSGACACTASSCPNGCCGSGSDKLCHTPATTTCGVGGATCTTCDAMLADRCDPATGACRCGANPGPCPAGNACLNGACVCTAASCANGCCANGACVPRSTAACGTMGGTCVPCDPIGADTCSVSGACLCGTSAPCAASQHCVNGACQCDATSCPNGCCGSGGVCRPGTSNGMCGLGGNACAQCQGKKCVNQQCQ